ncbi:amiloride-sensitive sodium channel subunit alpha-like isoform X2 [Dendronephthya gigantea]|uniref:amiloride-sensitive sodium channel subunit alpha-like isoform X2 n=1 Tax=Dendronephthya gigantea TaxID=151771 RepID=UPI00106D5B47|nr:amiloride-sensitive sodium channel subunit alpha-like isoform X2 [Dendronephthya gigantea]
MPYVTPVEMFNNGFEADTKKPSKKPSSSEPVEKTPKNSFRKLFKEFASDTSFGGISKVSSSDSHLRRFIWLLISTTCYGFTIYMCLQLIETFLNRPIKTEVDIVYEKNIDFPSVTVCNLNQYRRSRIRNVSSIDEIIRMYSDAKRNKSDGSNFENSINKQKRAFKKEFNNDVDDDDEGDISDDNIEIDEDFIIEELVAIRSADYDLEDLKKAGHQFNTILSCTWRGFNCKEGYFEKFWVQSWNWKYGNCFTFNPGAKKSGGPLTVFRTSKPGPYYGLTLEMNIEQQEYVNELTDEAGAIVIIHRAKQIPFPYDEGITVPPGFSSSIAIRKETIIRADPFKNGSCNPSTHLSTDNIYSSYLNGSASLYSVKACMQSCLARAQLDKCKCADPKYANFIDRICDETELDCMHNVSNSFKENRLGCNERCPQPCIQHGFRHNLGMSTLTSNAKESKKKKDFGDKKGPDFDFDENFLRVKIFYDELNLQKIVQSTYYDLWTLLADIGGQLGLWIGISIISIAEFGELLVSLCIVAGRKSRTRKTKTSEIELH